MDQPIFCTSTSGNTLVQYFNPPIVLDYNKKYSMYCINASIFFTFPNVFSSTSGTYTQNNILNFTVGATSYTITVPQGIYDINSLSTYVSQSLVNQGLASNLIVLSGDNPTQLAVVQLNANNVAIQFGTSSIRTLLGFNAITIGPGTSGDYYYGNNIANFNILTELLLHNSACTGFRNNASSTTSSISDIISPILINTGVGQQILYDPNQVIKVRINQWVIDKFMIYWTDQNNNLLVVNEPWNATFVITEEK